MKVKQTKAKIVGQSDSCWNIYLWIVNELANQSFILHQIRGVDSNCFGP